MQVTKSSEILDKVKKIEKEEELSKTYKYRFEKLVKRLDRMLVEISNSSKLPFRLHSNKLNDIFSTKELEEELPKALKLFDDDRSSFYISRINRYNYYYSINNPFKIKSIRNLFKKNIVESVFYIDIKFVNDDILL